MIRRLLVLVVVSIIAIGGSASLRPTRSANPEPCARVFRTEGGLPPKGLQGLQRKFVSQDCPYFKVDVEFRAVAHPEWGTVPVIQPSWGFEDNRDVIVKVSKPYLQFSIAD